MCRKLKKMIKRIKIYNNRTNKNKNIMQKPQPYLVVVINMIRTIKGNNLTIIKMHLGD